MGLYGFLVVLMWSYAPAAIAESEISLMNLPAGWEQWTPDPGLFQLYVNTDCGSNGSWPRIDILSEYASWPFLMQHLGDTVFLSVAPPGYKLPERPSLDQLPDEFTFVLRAGTERAVYRFFYNAEGLRIDTLLPGLFIKTIPVIPFPSDVAYLRLPGSGKHAKTIKQLTSRLKGSATLIQMENGFYQGFWYRVSKTTIRRWKLNEVAAGSRKVSTLLVFQLDDSESRGDVERILEEYREHAHKH